jgi:hypothetical protein
VYAPFSLSIHLATCTAAVYVYAATAVLVSDQVTVVTATHCGTAYRCTCDTLRKFGLVCGNSVQLKRVAKHCLSPIKPLISVVLVDPPPPPAFKSLTH